MTGILEMIGALLATVGLLALGWLIFGRLITPELGNTAPVFAVIPARGKGELLEYTVNNLVWIRECRRGTYAVLIVDLGLDKNGLALAEALRRRTPGLMLCSPESMCQYIQGELERDGCSCSPKPH